MSKANENWFNQGKRSFTLPLLAILTFALFGFIIVPTVARTGFHLSPPQIAGGVRCENWRSCSEANEAFTAILRRRFPPGSPEGVLEATLRAQGFRSLPSAITSCLPRGEEPAIGKLVIACPAWDPNWNPKNDLEYGWGRPPCGSELSVKWSSDASGMITYIEGRYDYSCL